MDMNLYWKTLPETTLYCIYRQRVVFAILIVLGAALYSATSYTDQEIGHLLHGITRGGVLVKIATHEGIKSLLTGYWLLSIKHTLLEKCKSPRQLVTETLIYYPKLLGAKALWRIIYCSLIVLTYHVLETNLTEISWVTPDIRKIVSFFIIIGLILLSFRLILADYVAINEPYGSPAKILGRSWELTRGCLIPVFIIQLIYAMLLAPASSFLANQPLNTPTMLLVNVSYSTLWLIFSTYFFLFYQRRTQPLPEKISA